MSMQEPRNENPCGNEPARCNRHGYRGRSRAGAAVLGALAMVALLAVVLRDRVVALAACGLSLDGIGRWLQALTGVSLLAFGLSTLVG